MMKKDLFGSGRTVFDDRTVRRISGGDTELLDPSKGFDEVAKHIVEHLVIANEWSDTGEHVVTGKEDSGP